MHPFIRSSETEDSDGTSNGSLNLVTYITKDLIRKKVGERMDFGQVFKLSLQPLLHDTHRIRFIENLDPLVNLRELNLSGNSILKIDNLEKLTQLTLLNLSDNKISRIENLEGNTKLEFLDISRNSIENLPVVAFKPLQCLRVLQLGQNSIKNLKSLYSLSHHPNLASAFFAGNPISDLPHYRSFSMFLLKSLHVLDGHKCTVEERITANSRFSREVEDDLRQELRKAKMKNKQLQIQFNDAIQQTEETERRLVICKNEKREQSEELSQLREELKTTTSLLDQRISEVSRLTGELFHLKEETESAKFGVWQEKVEHSHQVREQRGFVSGGYQHSAEEEEDAECIEEDEDEVDIEAEAETELDGEDTKDEHESLRMLILTNLELREENEDLKRQLTAVATDQVESLRRGDQLSFEIADLRSQIQVQQVPEQRDREQANCGAQTDNLQDTQHLGSQTDKFEDATQKRLSEAKAQLAEHLLFAREQMRKDKEQLSVLTQEKEAILTDIRNLRSEVSPEQINFLREEKQKLISEVSQMKWYKQIVEKVSSFQNSASDENEEFAILSTQELDQQQGEMTHLSARLQKALSELLSKINEIEELKQTNKQLVSEHETKMAEALSNALQTATEERERAQRQIESFKSNEREMELINSKLIQEIEMLRHANIPEVSELDRVRTEVQQVEQDLKAVQMENVMKDRMLQDLQRSKSMNDHHLAEQLEQRVQEFRDHHVRTVREFKMKEAQITSLREQLHYCEETLASYKKIVANLKMQLQIRDQELGAYKQGQQQREPDLSFEEEVDSGQDRRQYQQQKSQYLEILSKLKQRRMRERPRNYDDNDNRQ